MKIACEAFRRLRDKVFQWGERPITGRELADMMDRVATDMRESGDSPTAYDAGALERLRRSGQDDR